MKKLLFLALPVLGLGSKVHLPFESGEILRSFSVLDNLRLNMA